MATTTLKNETLKGGEFLIKQSHFSEIYASEEITEEQQMFAQMANDFVQKEVIVNINKIDKGDYDFVEKLLEKSGELGLLGAVLPQQFGGMEVDFNTASYIYEKMGAAGSFATTFAAHTGIGTLPILYFGTEKQKQKYLPDLATGKLKAAYCLTEPGSGSDALAAKTKATLMDDGEHYLIEGQKMWISNAGFADIFIVFAQVDGDKFTGFIIPADLENIELGAEEDKLGIKGSSTRQVFFQGVKVPKENLLGRIGKGHKIAFNVLNIGRYKLALMSLGGAKEVLNNAVNYANEREQFGKAISNFGAIKNKIAEMALQNWVLDASIYRVSGLVNNKIDALKADGKEGWQAKLFAAEEYAVECAILKVIGSEIASFCADENVQIHGGNGFSEEYKAARAYRDCRISRIYEGTNEINRLLAVGMIAKRAMKGKIDVFGAAQNVQKQLLGELESKKIDTSVYLGEELQAVENAKKAILMILGAAAMKFMQKLDEEQEVMMLLADMLIEVFAAESAILRAQKIQDLKGETEAEIYKAICETYLTKTLSNIYSNGKTAINYFADENIKEGMKMGLKKYTKYKDCDIIRNKKVISEKIISKNRFEL